MGLGSSFGITSETNNNIQTDGLIGYWDAAYKKSYVKDGTTWTDLAGSNNGTLTNTPTFSSDNNGLIEFDGTNDFVAFGTNPFSNIGSTSYTISQWINMVATSGTFDRSVGVYIDANNWLQILWTNHSGNGWNFACVDGGTKRMIGFDEGDSTSADVWFCITAVWDAAADSVAIYKNAIQQSKAYDGQAYEGGSTTGFNIARRPDGAGPLNARIATTIIYDRALKVGEVKQNFNAQRTRFGI